MRAARLVVLGAVLTSGCGASLIKLPTGPGVPAPNAADALSQASAACRGINSMTAEIGVSGSVGGSRLRGRLLAGLSEPSNARLEAPAPFGQPVFIFAAQGSEATLLLPRARRVLEHGRPDAVLEAVTGVPMTPAELRTTLTGCPGDVATGEAMTVGNGWIVFPGPRRVYLRQGRPADPWRVVATVQQDTGGTEWRTDYGNFVGDLPRSIRLASSDGRRFNLRLVLSQVETNVPIDAEAFRVQVPSGSDPITLEELRESGPLSEVASGSNGR
jgi:outer membrane lipoprotein-sorting protein